MYKTRFESHRMILNVFFNHLQNTLMARETPLLHGKCHFEFPFWLLEPFPYVFPARRKHVWMSSLARSLWGWRQDVLCCWQRLLQPGKFLLVLSRWFSCSLVFVSYQFVDMCLHRPLKMILYTQVMEKIRVKKIFPTCSCKSDCVGWALWKHLCIFCWNCDFTFFEVSSTTVLDLSWMFRSRYTLTVDNVETHERLSSGFMVSKNNFKVLLSTIFTDEAFFL